MSKKRMLAALTALIMVLLALPVHGAAGISLDAIDDTYAGGSSMLISGVTSDAYVVVRLANRADVTVFYSVYKASEFENGIRLTLDDSLILGTYTLTVGSGENTAYAQFELVDASTLNGIFTYDMDQSGVLARILSCEKAVSGRVTVPDEIEGHTVSRINSYAFEGCSAITNVTLPDNLSYIGAWAFSYCASLRGINLPESLTDLAIAAFYGCRSLGEITIPDSISTIRAYEFYNCSSLEAVALPRGIESIANYAFYGCGSLSDVYFAGSGSEWDAIEKGAGNDALDGATVHFALEDNIDYGTEIYTYEFVDGGISIIACDESVRGKIAVPSAIDGCSVVGIGDYAFAGIDKITTLTLPKTLKTIGSYAFMGCTGITKITVPSKVTSIGSGAFYGCTNLSRISLGSAVTSIGENAFYATAYYRDMTNWANGVLYIGNAVIRAGDSFVGALEMADTVTCIANGAFASSAIEGVVISGGITAIAPRAFASCTSLRSVTVPASVTSIKSRAFCDCGAIADVYYDGTEAQWSAISIGSYNTDLLNATFHFAEVEGDDDDDTDTDTDTDTDADSDTDEGSYTYEIVDSSAVITGYDGTLSGEVVIPSEIDGCAVTVIAAYAFEGNTGITSLEIPDGVAEIGRNAFHGNSSITTVTLPESITTIGKYAFSYCDAISDVYYGSTEAAWSLVNIGTANNRLVKANIHYSVKSGEFTYRIAKGAAVITGYAGALSGDVLIPDMIDGYAVNAIDAYAFDENTDITSLEIPEGVTEIGRNAFCNDSAIATVTLPASLTTIGKYAFSYCDAIGDVYYGLTEADWALVDIGTANNRLVKAKIHYYVPEDSFTYDISGGSASITGYTGTLSGALEIPAAIDGYAVTAIGEKAFYGENGITVLTFEEGCEVSEIGVRAFYECSSLETVNIPQGVTVIGKYAFSYCDAITDVYYGGTEAQWSLIGIGTANNRLVKANVHYRAAADEFTYRVKGSNAVITGYNGDLSGALKIPSAIDGYTVTAIDAYAFEGNTSITSIVIPDGVVEIGRNAFYGSTSVTAVTIPASVTTIGKYAFSYCDAIADVYYAGSKADWADIEIGTANNRLVKANIHYGE